MSLPDQTSADDALRGGVLEERRAGALGRGDYARIIDTLPVAAYAIDVQGRLVYFNPAAAALAGREPQIGADRWCVSWKLFQANGAPLPHDECPMAIALKERRELRGVEAILERPDGGRCWIEPYPTLLYDDDGEVTGAVNVLVDITERKRGADALREADRQKNRFLAQISHELRNPLSAIHNAIRALVQAGAAAGNGPKAQLHSIIQRQTDQLSRLVDDLLEISRIVHGKLALSKERVSLDDVLQRAIETARPGMERKSQALTVEAPAEAIRLHADPVRLSQIFSNLLGNAVKFSQPCSRIALSARRDGADAVVTVSDNGPGISPEMLPRLFDPFTQAEADSGSARAGLGIGLALVRSLVELHGGTVTAESDGPGKGSAFVVRLPLDP